MNFPGHRGIEMVCRQGTRQAVGNGIHITGALLTGNFFQYRLFIGKRQRITFQPL
ncbi:hypothetical protein DFR30_1529 [Thiogranum longum]|uniref:Uncharacterized protein n=1 Tax=Thiogranum longum TaxID=1537524 RepID=A0A4R1H8T7_9GAMM|nr:hypothetical protein DFR30_1529 [Thiogranum longum]